MKELRDPVDTLFDAIVERLRPTGQCVCGCSVVEVEAATVTIMDVRDHSTRNAGGKITPTCFACGARLGPPFNPMRL